METRTHYRNGDPIELKHHLCDGCSPSIIDGTFCHERGCPDAWRDQFLECRECGVGFYPDSGGNLHFCTDECAIAHHY